jgi:enhancing lycopene biosynthesis protein 2
VEKLIIDMNAASKPIGFICIAPVIGAKVLGGKAPSLTIGNDAGTAEAVEKFGAKHVDCATDNCVVDAANKIVSTPAYMLGPNVAMVNEGISKLVKEVIAMI